VVSVEGLCAHERAMPPGGTATRGCQALALDSGVPDSQTAQRGNPNAETASARHLLTTNTPGFDEPARRAARRPRLAATTRLQRAAREETTGTKMQRQARATIAAAIVSLTAAVPAAASTATASMTDFHVELIDLDPSDGIAPSLTFQNLDGGLFIAAESGAPGHVTTDTHHGGVPFGGGSSSSMNGAASALASFVGDPRVPGAGGQASASASTGVRGLYGASTVQLGDGAMVVPFTLSADTRLVITADASASALSTFADPYADTWASVFLKLTDAAGTGSISTDGASAEQFAMIGGTPSAVTDSRQITISFENLTNGDLGGLFFGSIDAYAADLSPAAVPEPGSLPLLAAGLGVLAWRLRRRPR